MNLVLLFSTHLTENMSSLSIAQRLQKMTPTNIPMGNAAEAKTISLSLQILEFSAEKSAKIQLVKKRN